MGSHVAGAGKSRATFWKRAYHIVYISTCVDLILWESTFTIRVQPIYAPGYGEPLKEVTCCTPRSMDIWHANGPPENARLAWYTHSPA